MPVIYPFKDNFIFIKNLNPHNINKSHAIFILFFIAWHESSLTFVQEKGRNEDVSGVRFDVWSQM
jgi:hypothetical protein